MLGDGAYPLNSDLFTDSTFGANSLSPLLHNVLPDDLISDQVLKTWFFGTPPGKGPVHRRSPLYVWNIRS